jgi:sulfatase modifying factor 1
LPEGFKRVRLASEAQWEYACRAGGQSIFASGDDGTRLTEFGNVADATLRAEAPSWPLSVPSSDKHAFTAPAGEFPENALGICDLTGNVMEWCRDRHEPFPALFPDALADPEGPAKGEMRVIRGGSFLGGILQQRVSRRNEDAPEKRLLDLGFRLVIEP